MKKSILFICNTSKFFITHRINLAIECKKKGYEVVIATPNNFQQSEILNKYNFIHKQFFLKRSSLNIFNEIKSFISLYSLIFKYRHSIIHLITIKPILYGGVASRLIKKDKLIYSFTGLGYIFSEKNFFIKLLKYFICKLFKISLNNKNSKYIFQNDKDKMQILPFIKKNKRQNIHIIQGSGVNLNLFKPYRLKDKTFKILMASRLLKSKGVYEYIEAAKIIYFKKMNIQFILVGDIDDNPDSLTKDEKENLKKNKYINYIGYEDNMISLFKEIDISVLPSYYGEGIPKFLIESAACGKPIVTSNIIGCKNTIIDKETGFLISPKKPEEITKKILKLHSDRNLFLKMSLNARQYAEKKFDIMTVTKKHIDIYEQLNS